LTVPEPLPEAEPIVIQLAELTAVHAQPAAVVTVMLFPPPAAATANVVGESE
jgi:hypothetical protein